MVAPAEDAATQRQREYDSAALERIRDALPRPTVRKLLREQDFSGSWRWAGMNPVYEVARLDDVKDRFLDPELEKLRTDFQQKINVVRQLFNTKTWRKEGNTDWQDVGVKPRGPDDPETLLWEERTEALNNAATEAADDARIDLARRKMLLVD